MFKDFKRYKVRKQKVDPMEPVEKQSKRFNWYPFKFWYLMLREKEFSIEKVESWLYEDILSKKFGYTITSETHTYLHGPFYTKQNSQEKIKTMKLDTNLMEELTNKTNRSRNQTQFLFELCDFNFEKLVELERKLKNNFVMYVPGDKDEVSRVLSLGEGKDWFKLEPRFEFVWGKNELPSVNEFPLEKKLRYKLLGYTNKFEDYCYHLNWTGVYPLPVVKVETKAVVVETKASETKPTYVKPTKQKSSFVNTNNTNNKSKVVISDQAARAMIGDFLKTNK